MFVGRIVFVGTCRACAENFDIRVLQLGRWWKRTRHLSSIHRMFGKSEVRTLQSPGLRNRRKKVVDFLIDRQ